MDWIKNIFKHRHKWECTHTNKWMITTREECKKCGLSREIKTTSPIKCKWVYSDNTESKEFNW